MTRGTKKKQTAGTPGQPRQSLPLRQRQRLIDACITALHLYGPSGTTVARVVAIARLSPGIVRFYFQSKAAMLVASLQYLATEFEERVVTPVAAMRGQPALALERLVDLYLDPDIASPRKVAVWYAFWGEASARQEYLAICGQKDANFAELVQDLVHRMIESSGRRHLDGEAVALGLIGVLEIIWQGFAFEEEANIDRPLARRRCMAYLRSVFPRDFAAVDGAEPLAATARRLPATDAGDGIRVFRAAWQFIGHERELAQPGDFVAVELPETRALVLRDSAGTVRAFRNACRSQPHALVAARRGRFADGRIVCALHALAYDLQGRAAAPHDGAGLLALEVHLAPGLVFVRAPSVPAGQRPASVAGLAPAIDCAPVADTVTPTLQVEADWSIVVQQLLESRLPPTASGTGAIRFDDAELEIVESQGTMQWRGTPSAGGDDRNPRPPGGAWRRQFLWPSLLVEQRPGWLSLLQVQPLAAGRSRVQQFVYAVGATDATATNDVLRDLLRVQLESELALAVSTQQGATDPGYQADGSVPSSPAVAAFRRMLLDAES